MISFKSLIKKFPSLYKWYWNNHWKRGIVKYRTKTGSVPVDVRTVLSPDHPDIDLLAQEILKYSKTYEAIAINVLRWVTGNVRYVRDIKKYGKPEYWQTAPETWASLSGDCEDGAILIMKLLELCGVPAWRRKLCCGYVKTPHGKAGHAYCIFLGEDFEWYVLDWCYYPLDSVIDFGRKPHRLNKHYEDVWFTFNEKYSWTEQVYTLL